MTEDEYRKATRPDYVRTLSKGPLEAQGERRRRQRRRWILGAGLLMVALLGFIVWFAMATHLQ